MRSILARGPLQEAFRLLYRFALVGMNYGGAGSTVSSGDEQALERLRRMRQGSEPLVVLDVGANIGSYVSKVLQIVGQDTNVYALEPSRAAFEQLENAFGGRANVHLVCAGAAAAPGAATLWSAVPGSVLATTYAKPIDAASAGEPIELITLDDFCAKRGISRIHLLKLDVEGGEVDALRGASRLLESDAIDMIQFEFGQPSIGARTYFADLFALLSERFEIYRVLPTALVRIAEYHETLEVFMSTNYLALRKRS